MHTKKRIAVIGSGFGGLSAAIRLQAAGYQVRIFEKRDMPGGRAYVYKDKGFTFDAGPTVITAPECLEELFALKGKRMSDYVEMMPVMPFYRLLWDDGYRFDYSNDVASLEGQIAKKSADDLNGYRRFLKYSEEVFNQGYTKLAAKPFLNIWSMVKVAPQLVKLEAYRSVYDIVSKYIKDDHLRQAFSFHSLLVGGNPFSTSSIYTLIHFLERNWGVYFPKGGTGALVRALVKYFQEMGGEIVFQKEVEEILTSQGRVRAVRSRDGEVWECATVVSNGDVVHTYKDLLANEPSVQRKTKELQGKSFSMSLFLIYFGTKRKYPNLAHHNVLFGPRYKELLEDIFQKGTLPDDFSLYLHVPSLTDSSLAPEGHECFYVLAPVAHLGKMNIDWKKEGPVFADKILRYMEEKYMPGLRESIVTQRIFTPEDFVTELNSYHGSAFSLEPKLTQSAFFRQHNKDSNLKGLYFVGAGTHPGAGVPGVVNSAKATAGLILEDLNV
ncbi:phytoene desaturase [Bdellovibrio sp. HCB290]|uniref:phytoene desaturase n=1 Tax=Bdellovibrio sp. HCB290 TaxID=3394356 RepID=UPI0039B4F865